MDDLLNFYQSTAKIATSGQPTKAQFEQVAASGCVAVINLAMPDSDNAIADEGYIVTSLGMSYFHLPVPFDKPTVAHLRRFIDLMNLLGDEKVLVHCALNARVSAFMYKYLTLSKHQSSQSARSPLLERWLENMDDAWKAIVELDAQDLER